VKPRAPQDTEDLTKDVQEVNRQAILLTQKSHPGRMTAAKTDNSGSGFLFPERVALFTGIRTHRRSCIGR
jgi:hypothetical protein